MSASGRSKQFKILLGIGLGLAGVLLVIGFQATQSIAPGQTPDSLSTAQVFDPGSDQTTCLVSGGIESAVDRARSRSATGKSKKLAEAIATLPLSFEQNLGQVDKQVRFMTRGRGFTFYLTPKESVLTFRRRKDPDVADVFVQSVMRIRYQGASKNPTLIGLEEKPGKSNYFIGNNPEQWTQNVPHFGRVKYEGLYPGIDLVYYGIPGALEHDFLIQPNADPYAIELAFDGLAPAEGSAPLRVTEKGDLIVASADGPLTISAPLSYQMTDGKRTVVDSRYVVRGENRVGFEVAAYDKGRQLVIDPVLGFSTYLGGNGTETLGAITADSSSLAYVTGSTASTNFPTTNQTTILGGTDIFITKFDKPANTLVFSTYLNGTNGTSVGNAIDLDEDNRPHVAGTTNATDFPLVKGFQAASGGGSDAIVIKIETNGGIAFSTYIGGSGNEAGNGIVLDSQSVSYVIGTTTSTDFPTKDGAFQASLRGGTDGFLTGIGLDGTSTTFVSYFGGTGEDVLLDVALDSADNVYITGHTSSDDINLTDIENTNSLPSAASASVFQKTRAGSVDAFAAKIKFNTTNVDQDDDGNNDNSLLMSYFTYLGGTASESTSFAGIAIDENNIAYITGTTASTNFPTSNPFQAASGGSTDAFVAALSGNASSLVFSTYLGGSGADEGHDLGVDTDIAVHVTGITSSANFPTAEVPVQSALAGGSDAFMTRFTTFATGSNLAANYSTYIGGTGNETSAHMFVSSPFVAFMGGTTTSTDFPIVDGVFQESFNGGTTEAYVAQITAIRTADDPDSSLLSAILFAEPITGLPSLLVSFDATQSNDRAGGRLVNYIWDFGDGTTTTSTTNTISHTYTTAGVFVASLQVEDNIGELSPRAYVTITVGDLQVNDSDLFVSMGKAVVDYRVFDNDKVSLRGFLNPAGLDRVTSNAKLDIKLNGSSVRSATIGVKKRSSARTKDTVIAHLNPQSGFFLYRADALDLLDIAGYDVQQSGKRTITMQIEVVITDSDLDTTTAKGVVDMIVLRNQGKTVKGHFDNIGEPTYTGYFKSVVTGAKTSGSGFEITSKGAIEAEFSGAIVPTGDLTLTIGGDGSGSTGDIITIPLASLGTKGSGANTVLTLDNGAVAELRKFQINNATHTFTFATNALTGTTIPAVGAAGVRFNLRIILAVPTINGTVTYSTNVELLRASTTSDTWSR